MSLWNWNCETWCSFYWKGFLNFDRLFEYTRRGLFHRHLFRGWKITLFALKSALLKELLRVFVKLTYLRLLSPCFIIGRHYRILDFAIFIPFEIQRFCLINCIKFIFRSLRFLLLPVNWRLKYLYSYGLGLNSYWGYWGFSSQFFTRLLSWHHILKLWRIYRHWLHSS